MKILHAGYLLGAGEGWSVLKEGAVCFDDRILDIGDFRTLRSRYPEAEEVEAGSECVVMPGLVNPHVHLEFSANTTTLKLGVFVAWLKSVIAHRDLLRERCLREGCIQKALLGMIRGGTTAIGAVSSFGDDLEACAASKIRVVFFNEVLGSNPAAADALYGDFLQRFRASERYESDRFVPAVSVHSPYSTHPVLAAKAIALAKESGCAVSTHFMESAAEREWLEKGSGEFAAFFRDFLPTARPMIAPLAYLDLFEGVRTLVTHAVWADETAVSKMAKMGMYLTHCPVSNRLLGSGRLDLERLERKGIAWHLGTDGMSSNFSLNLWDEMRAALMLHPRRDPVDFAHDLLKAATRGGAEALGIDAGVLQKGKAADLAVVKLPDAVVHEEDLPLQLILHTTNAEETYIAGERIDGVF